MKKCIWVLIVLLALAGIVVICHYYIHKGGDNLPLIYSIEQFNNITVLESTFEDVNKIAPATVLCATSYGGYAEYPCEDGKLIRIKFYGADLIVYSVEIIE